MKDKVENLIKTIEDNSKNNIAIITNVELWAKRWREELGISKEHKREIKKVIGITNKGETKVFHSCENGVLTCNDEKLISIDVPLGIRVLHCYNNEITNLILPKGIELVNCHNNKIEKLDIPNTLKTILCDKDVKGLEKITWDCHITLF